MSIFGKAVDDRCEGYNWIEKLLVLIGFLGDAKENEACSRLDTRFAQIFDE